MLVMKYLVPALFFLRGALCMGGQSAAGVDGLSAEDVAKAVSALKENFVRPEELSDTGIARATLQGLLDRLAPAASLTGTANRAAASPFYSEEPGAKTGYLRLGELAPGNVEKARGSLTDWARKGVEAVVLDLRGTPGSSDFDAGARLAGFFCAKGTEMFSLKAGAHPAGEAIPASRDRTFSAAADPLFNGILVVLVDGETAEAPEAVASCLRKCAKALVVGDQTAGRAFQYGDFPLDGAVLRVAVAQVILPDGKEPGEKGLTPDISVGLGGASKADVMRSISMKGVESIIKERGRAHLNEAALVSRSNPEVDELEAEQTGKNPPEPLIDRQLQRALDLVTSILVYQGKGDGK